MAYISQGRRPMERASKISHAQLIANPTVAEFLGRCAMPAPADPAVVANAAVAIDTPEPEVRVVVAVDGSYSTAPVRNDYPSASITFFSFGALLFKLDALAELDERPFIDPDEWAAFRKIQRYSLVLPTENVSVDGRSLTGSVRRSLHEFLTAAHDDEPLSASLRWLLFRGWKTDPEPWVLPSCPNEGCDRQKITLRVGDPDERTCEACGGPIYISDALRLHERVALDESAGGISAYVINALEHLAVVHVVRLALSLRPDLLRSMLLIKDGPLAFFGNTAPLRLPMRELAQFLMDKDPSGSLLLAVGVEKSGAFSEHAHQIADSIPPGSALLLENDYIYKHIRPGDPKSSDPYGFNTYWGSKLIYRAPDKNLYVATVPTRGTPTAPKVDDFPRLPEILSVLARLRCSMYDNALIPVALANRLVSLSEYPSSRILQAFAVDSLGTASP